MVRPFKEINSNKNTVLITQPKESKEILERKKTAYTIALHKHIKSGGKIESTMQIAEAFGRGLYYDFISDKKNSWTLNEWIEPVVQNIFNPLGTGAAFTNITEEQAKSIIFRYLGDEKEEKDPYFSSLFTYGYLRGLLKSAFPQGELIMNQSMADGAPIDEFIFKKKATEEDIIERERIKLEYLHNTNIEF